MADKSAIGKEGYGASRPVTTNLKLGLTCFVEAQVGAGVGEAVDVRITILSKVTAVDLGVVGVDSQDVAVPVGISESLFELGACIRRLLALFVSTSVSTPHFYLHTAHLPILTVEI